MPFVLHITPLHAVPRAAVKHGAVVVEQVGFGKGGISAVGKSESGRRSEQLTVHGVDTAFLVGLYPPVLERAAGIPDAGSGRERAGRLFAVYAAGAVGGNPVTQGDAVVEPAGINEVGLSVGTLDGVSHALAGRIRRNDPGLLAERVTVYIQPQRGGRDDGPALIFDIVTQAPFDDIQVQFGFLRP